MRRLALALLLAVSFSCFAFGQSTDNTPASRQDIERYFQVAKSHDMLKKLAGSMTQTMHQVAREQCLKHKDELPADCESKLTAMTDEMLKNMPWDEMMQAMIPAYQKHFTKGDVDNLVAFYSSPTGQKILEELPTIMTDAMQDMMPVMNKYMETVQSRIQKEAEAMIAQSKKSANAGSASHN